MTGEPRVDETSSGVGQQSQSAQRRLALQAGRHRCGQTHLFPRRTEHELARVQHERVLVADFDQPGQFGLLLGGVDVRVAVVLEHSEEPVKTYVDARRLEHRGIPRLQGDPSLGHLGQDVSVAQKHAPSLMVSGSGLGMSCGEQCGVVVVRPSSRDTFRSDRGLGAHETCSLALQNPLLWLF